MVELGNCFTHCINDTLQPFEQRPLEFCSIFYLLGARGEVKSYGILMLLFATHTDHVQVREDFSHTMVSLAFFICLHSVLFYQKPKIMLKISQKNRSLAIRIAMLYDSKNILS